MCFINGDKAYWQVFEAFAELFRLEAFGTALEEMIRSVEAVIQRYALFVVSLSGIDSFGVNAAGL